MNKKLEGFEDIEDPRERALAQRIEENLSHFAEVEPPADLWSKIAARIETDEPVRPVAEPEARPIPLFPQVPRAARRTFGWRWLALPALGAAALVAALVQRADLHPSSQNGSVMRAAIPGAATAPGDLLPSIAPDAKASHWDQVAEAFRQYLSSHGTASKGRSP